MKLGHMFFNSVWDPTQDADMIADLLKQARDTEAAGLDAVWLAEHHFSGQCHYAEPLTVAAAIAAVTERIEIGIAVVQASLRDPIRLAEQISLVDNISKGRLLTGLGQGTRFAHFEWAPFGVRVDDARARMAEVEQIMHKAWAIRPRAAGADKGDDWVAHKGQFFDLTIPSIRPQPYTRPHPRLIHPATSEGSIKGLGARGESFLMHMVSPQIAETQVAWFRTGAQEAGRSEAEIAALLKQVWTWRQVYVASSDAQAEAEGSEFHKRMWLNLWIHMEDLNGQTGYPKRPWSPDDTARMADRLFWGGPEKVAGHIRHLQDLGLGGVFMEFRFGGMTYEEGKANLDLFAREVAPRVREQAALEPA